MAIFPTLFPDSPKQPVATTTEQAEQLFDPVTRCQVKKTVSGACTHSCQKLSDRRIQRADFYDGYVMFLMWKELSAAGHIASYQSSIHIRHTNVFQRQKGVEAQMPLATDDGNMGRAHGFASFTGRGKLQSWDDSEMHRAEKPHPMAAQLEQALHYSQSQEYDDLTTQTCQNAIQAFNRLTDGLTAERIGQMVVVMDIDGTVVNNSPWIAGLCRKGQLSTQESHSRWAVSQQATAIKGVKELVGAYRKKKVPVIWVSNRIPGLKPGDSGDEVRKATEAHLRTLGLFEDGEQILLKGDCSGKDSTGKIDTHKRHRFDAIRKGLVIPGRTEIVQMVGDDPADLEINTEPFYDVDSNTWPEDIKKEIGVKRILIPNPLFYRGWHKDLVRHWGVSGKTAVTKPAALAAMNRLELGRWFPGDALHDLQYLNLRLPVNAIRH